MKTLPSNILESSNQNYTVIVTGAAGFIGAKVCELLLSEGYQVVGIDNINSYYNVKLKIYRIGKLTQLQSHDFHKLLSDENSQKITTKEIEKVFRASANSVIEDNTGQFKFHIGDIENNEFLRRIFKIYKPRQIINLAARAGVRASMDNPEIYLRTNSLGCLNLLEFAKSYDVEKFILASTSSLYAGEAIPFSENLSVNKPISPYAASKKSAEMMAYTYHYLYEFSVSILRYFTVYGPAGRPDMSVLRFIKWIKEKVPISLYGNGTQSRDFTYIDDIARGTVLSMKLKGHNVINLGGGLEPVKLNKLIQIIESKLNQKAEIKELPFEKSDITHTQADNSHAFDRLNWTPIVSIDKGINETINWFNENYWWLKNINFNEK